jgi:hypothetical protein
MSLPGAALTALTALAAEADGLLGSSSTEQWEPGRFDRLLGPMALLVGLLLLVVFTARLRRRRKQVEAAAREAASDRRPAAGGREALERMALDLEEVARSISALLDTRMRMLERLIRDADQRIETLKATGGGTTGTPALPPAAAGLEQPPPPPPPAPPPVKREMLAHHAGIFSLADQGLSVSEIAEKTGCPHGEVELVLSLRRAAGSDSCSAGPAAGPEN